MALTKRFTPCKGLDANSFTVANVLDPVNAQDASTKAFSSNASNLTSGTLSLARLTLTTNILLGRSTAGSGTAEEISIGSGLTLSAGVLSASGGGGLTVTNDASTSTALYPLFTSTTSGTASAASVSTAALTFVPSTGTLYSTVFSSSSDERLKDNLTVLTNATAQVRSAQGFEFDWKATGQHSYGFSAQQLEAVLTPLVSTDANGIKSVNYNAAVAILWQAFNELDTRLKLAEQHLAAKV